MNAIAVKVDTYVDEVWLEFDQDPDGSNVHTGKLKIVKGAETKTIDLTRWQTVALLLAMGAEVDD